MLDSTSFNNSQYWAQLLITPLPFPLNSFAHSYIGLKERGKFFRIELKTPSSYKQRDFIQEVDEFGIYQGLEMFPFNPFLPKFSSEVINSVRGDRDLVQSIIEYVRTTLFDEYPFPTYSPMCTSNCTNSNTFTSFLCSKFPQLGELPKEAVGRRVRLDDMV